MAFETKILGKGQIKKLNRKMRLLLKMHSYATHPTLSFLHKLCPLTLSHTFFRCIFSQDYEYKNSETSSQIILKAHTGHRIYQTH